MPKVKFKKGEDDREIEIPVGWTVMEGAVQNDIDGILAECGGGCACATCHVYVDNEYLQLTTPMSDVEADMLECVAAERKDNSRLSCQIRMSEQLEGIMIEIPETQL